MTPARISVPDPVAEAVVLDASAAVEALLGSITGLAVRQRMRATQLHTPAHLDAEVLSALGRLHRAGDVPAGVVTTGLTELATAPIVRHPLPGLLPSAWQMRDQLRLVDALYVALSEQLGARLLTTDARLARGSGSAELVSAGL
jgi:predicted nucleic acid-binding protein